MAVSEQTPYIEYTANGTTTSFALEFDCENQNHLIVLVDDVEPVVGAWSFSNGAVVFNTAPENGKKITLQRNTPFSRTTDYQSYNNSFRPPAVNKDFDWIWWKLQELGVADWILSNRIDALKNYVDDRDDELRAYLMEEIRKQGVDLDQLEDYYNYLMQRLAEIAVNGGWESSFVSYGSINQKKYNDGVESIAELLAIQNPFDGMRVFAKSYYVGENKGGDDFYFDSTKSAVNDGVITFNGWVRDLSDRVLTTDDAGVNSELSESVIYERIQTLLTVVGDDFFVELKGDFTFSKPLEIYQKKNLELDLTRFKYTANTDWNFNFSVIPAGSFVPRGMIIGYHCPDIKIKGGDIRGVNSNNKTTQIAIDPFQDGDSGIQLLACPRYLIEHVKIRNTFAWGILAEQSAGGICRHNDIADVYRQSGINPVVGSDDSAPTYVYGNTIRRCALYGIEIETYGASTHFICFDNVISDCYTGVTVTTGSNCKTIGSVHGNTVYNSGENAIWITKVYQIGSDVAVHGNQIRSSFRGIHVSGNVRNTHVFSNNLEGKLTEDYYRKISPDLLVLKVISTNQFLTTKTAITAGGTSGTFYIDGVPITIQSVVDSSEDWGIHSTSGTMSLVTVNENTIVPSMLWKQLTRLMTTGTKLESGLTSSSGTLINVRWFSNSVNNYQMGILKQGGNPNDDSFTEEFVKNSLTNCPYFAINQIGESKGTKYIDNITDTSTISDYPFNMLKNGNVKLKSVNHLITSAQRASNPDPHPSVNFYSPNEERFIAMYLVAKSSSCTGSMSVNINGTVFISGESGAGNKIIKSRYVVPKGLNTITLADTVGDLLYNGYEIFFLVE